MTLPASGPLGMSDIATEIYGSVGSNRSLGTMSDLAEFSPPDKISDFYSFSYVKVYCSYGSITYITNTPTEIDAYRTVNRSGHASPVIITISIPYQIGATASGATATIFYRINGGSWVNVTSISYPTETSGTMNITNVDYNDTVEVRQKITIEGYIYFTNITGEVTSGGPGAVYRTGTYTWYTDLSF